MDDFILGLIESTKELGQPFISESIWTEALQDVAPILGRGGRDATGREIYNQDPAIDPIGSKIMKSVAHLVEAQAPLNWRQLGRLGLTNPFEGASDIIERIREVLEAVPLGADLFPDTQNPLSNLPEPTLGAAASLPGLPPMPNPALVNNAQFGSIDPVSRLTLAEETYLSPLEQSYRKKQRTT